MTRVRSAALLLLLAVLILCVVWLFANSFHSGNSFLKNFFRSPQGEYIDYGYRVVKVVDGDTIDVQAISGGKVFRVRYIGMDTPETVDPRKPAQCFGKEASEFNKSLVYGKIVGLEKDVSETDRYGRLLRFVYLPDDGGGPLMVNEILVRKGYARIDTVPPDVSGADLFSAAEKEARAANLGLWSACGNNR